jgi:hypothetical protein
MKKIIFMSAMIILVIIIRLNAKPIQAVSFDFFYSSLSPYGEWIDLQDGVTAWRPNNISPDWKPYSIGRWSWTNNGWYWDSDEPFGWATYHYGRWYNDENYGWIWVPDYEWAPAWVEWRYDNDYIGWAPLPPYASFSSNLGIRFSLGWHSHYRSWNFVNYGHFCDFHINRFFMDERRVSRFFEHTRYRTNYYSDRDRIINGGIDRSFIERRGGFRIPEREIRTVDNFRDYDRNRNDRNGRIIAYRPSASEINNTRTRENFEIKKGENRSSLERDKIRLPMDNRNSGISGDRVNERARDAEINRGTQPNREERTGSENRNNLRNNRRTEERVQRNMNREQPQINQAPNSERRSSRSERRIEQRGNRGTEKYLQQRDRNNQRSTPRQQRSSKSEKDTKKDDSRQR